MVYTSKGCHCKYHAFIIKLGFASVPYTASSFFWKKLTNVVAILTYDWRTCQTCCLRSSWLNVPCPTVSMFEGVCLANNIFLGSDLIPRLMFLSRHPPTQRISKLCHDILLLVMRSKKYMQLK